jgi:hypothetical protein
VQHEQRQIPPKLRQRLLLQRMRQSHRQTAYGKLPTFQTKRSTTVWMVDGTQSKSQTHLVLGWTRGKITARKHKSHANQNGGLSNRRTHNNTS